MTDHQDELIFNNQQAELLNRNQYESGGWLHSPANLQLFARSVKQLVGLNRALSIDEKWVPYVRAARPKGKDIVYIYPTDEHDPNKIDVHKRDGNAWINLRSLLEPSHHTVELGYRVRYEIVAVNDSPVGPALKLDLAKEVERRLKPPSKRRGRSARTKGAQAES